MTKIVSTPNCGNSPKMAFLKDFNIAFAQGNIAFLLESVSDDIIWNMVGKQKIVGKEDFTKALAKMKDFKARELILEQILTHGKEGAASGQLKMDGNKTYAFSDFYLFNGAKGEKIKQITSYLIEV
ncbi:DNA-binding protein [Wenyingzhuangia fucanilytica]|uniref:DNA-binding protein n=1 Tax=Wenyingzhuangia fucanilytica TaxID=1790137 RepID=A0A1B1Y705_9FLAO|nr:nuclear transport factor 2 family protein [Wenyingzhuangia fucanilytica]ANW96543.1 DNA-binding protein [Wenyingzhuangia fucanilytica]